MFVRNSIENKITYNATKTVHVCMYVRPKCMYHIGPVKQFLYGNELRWVDKYKYLGCYLTSDFADDRDLKRQARAIYSRGNMIVRKFSTCSVANYLGPILVVCTVVHYG